MATKKSREEVKLSFDKLRKITESTASRIHFVGIGGVSAAKNKGELCRLLFVHV